MLYFQNIPNVESALRLANEAVERIDNVRLLTSEDCSAALTRLNSYLEVFFSQRQMFNMSFNGLIKILDYQIGACF